MTAPQQRHAVAVTGLGVVTPLGRTVATFEEAIFAGRSGAALVRSFDASSLPTRIAAEVPAAAADSEWRDRKIAFALEAAREAIAAARRQGPLPPGPSSLSLGIGLELFSLDDMVALRRDPAARPATPNARGTFLQTPSDLAAHLLAREHGLDAPPLLHISACAAGADAIGQGFRQVSSGRRRWVLAGGADSMVNPMAMAGFAKLHATTRRNDAPGRASRPFDRGRDGFLLGEGAAFLVLERLEDALARGAEVYGLVAGYGNAFDAHGITEPHPEGRGAVQAMGRALTDAGIGPEQVDAINAHGTSTPKNDAIETLAIKRLLGDRARQVPISAIKSMTGHLIAAAGAMEAVVAILGVRSGRVPPTINLDDPDPACDLDYVPHVSRNHEQRNVLSNSFGFGGQNAALVLRRFDG